MYRYLSQRSSPHEKPNPISVDFASTETTTPFEHQVDTDLLITALLTTYNSRIHQTESGERFLRYRDWYSKNFGPNYSNYIYLSSSDGLKVLNQIEGLKNKSAMTVAANGDFAQILLEKDLKNLVVFDISLPTLSYAELKISALRHLDFDLYDEFINSWKESEKACFVNPVIYREHLRMHLSPHARSFFDALLDDPTSPIVTDTCTHYGAVLLERRNFKSKKPSTYIGDIIKTKEDFERLQMKARQTDITYQLCDLEMIPELQEEIEVIYISNIQNLKASMHKYQDLLFHKRQGKDTSDWFDCKAFVQDYFKNLFAKGIKRIVCSHDIYPTICSDKPKMLTEDGGIMIEATAGEKFNVFGINGSILGCDSDMVFGAILEFRKEDNLHLFVD